MRLCLVCHIKLPERTLFSCASFAASKLLCKNCAGIYQSMRCAVCIEDDGANNGIRFVNRLKKWMEEKRSSTMILICIMHNSNNNNNRNNARNNGEPREQIILTEEKRTHTEAQCNCARFIGLSVNLIGNFSTVLCERAFLLAQQQWQKWMLGVHSPILFAACDEIVSAINADAFYRIELRPINKYVICWQLAARLIFYAY